MRAAAVQLNSTEDKPRNVERAERFTRAAAADGAELIVLPEKFNLLGTHEHYVAGAEALDGSTTTWARAIENQAFVVAADQIGRHPPANESFGGSQIVDPWGEVLARAEDEECFVSAELDLHRLEQVREQLPSLANRIPGAYEWPPEPAGVAR